MTGTRDNSNLIHFLLYNYGTIIRIIIPNELIIIQLCLLLKL